MNELDNVSKETDSIVFKFLIKGNILDATNPYEAPEADLIVEEKEENLFYVVAPKKFLILFSLLIWKLFSIRAYSSW